MYDVDQTEYGMKVTLGGTVSEAEMREFNEECRRVVDSQTGEFGVFGDLRGLETLSDDAERQLADAMAYTKKQGFTRAAVVVDSPILDLQQEHLGEEVGVASAGRVVIDASAVDDWEAKGLDWVKDGVEP